MSRYSKIIIPVILVLFYGCGVKQPEMKVKTGKKAFANEDELIIQALEFERLKKYKDAIKTYDILYKKSKKPEYLKEEAKLSFLAFSDDNTYKIISEGLKKDPKSVFFKRLLIGYYLNKKEYKKAEKVALELIEIDKSARNLQILGNIYLKQKSYNLALKYFQSAFKLNNSEDMLLNMVDLLYRFLNRKKDAISYLETYIRLNNASENTYFALLKIYGQSRDINGLVSVYKRLYKKFKKDEYAKKVIDLLMYKNDKKSAINFLKNSGYNKELLLDLYTREKDYKNAYLTAEQLYNESGNIDYLGKMAIFEYESNKDKLNSKILDSISQKFEKVVEKLQLPIYLNYYGYLLIDYDLDIKKGIKLVKMALDKEPKSPFYLDSLAWGYYKLGKCDKAMKVMEKFIKETNEPEVVMHYKKIKKCLQQREN